MNTLDLMRECLQQLNNLSPAQVREIVSNTKNVLKSLDPALAITTKGGNARRNPLRDDAISLVIKRLRKSLQREPKEREVWDEIKGGDFSFHPMFDKDKKHFWQIDGEYLYCEYHSEDQEDPDAITDNPKCFKLHIKSFPRHWKKARESLAR